MSELMAQAESIAMLDKEMNVQVALIEKLHDRLAEVERGVLELERTRAMKRSSNKEGRGSPHPLLQSQGE